MPLFAKVCQRIIPVREERIRFTRLEPIFLDTPPLALAQTTDAVRKMLSKAWRMVNCALKLYDIDDKVNQQLAEIRKVSRHVANICERADQVYPASHRIG